MVRYFLKKLTVNGFVAWIIKEGAAQLRTSLSFGSVDHYRDVFGRTLSFADWICEVFEELLEYSDMIDGTSSELSTRINPHRQACPIYT